MMMEVINHKNSSLCRDAARANVNVKQTEHPSVNFVYYSISAAWTL